MSKTVYALLVLGLIVFMIWLRRRDERLYRMAFIRAVQRLISIRPETPQ